MNDIVATNTNLPVAQGETEQSQGHLFGRSLIGAGANVGAVTIESERAIAETQGQIIVAQRMPRSMAQARAELIEACKNKEFAETAFYSVPNRGSGPSIRFAEEVARVYGNFQYGHRELSRMDDRSEIEVYAWDVQKNNRSTRQITVMHVVDTKQGPKVLRDQADIDNKIANVASKQMRGRILALVSKELVATGVAECKKTLAGTNKESMTERVKRMTQAFDTFGVTVKMMETHLGHSLDNVTVDEIADLQGIFNAIKEGGKASEFFGQGAAAADPAAAIKGAAARGKDDKKAAPQQAKAEGGSQAAQDGKAAASGDQGSQQPKEEPKADPKPEPEPQPETKADPEPEPEKPAEAQGQGNAPAAGPEEAVF